MVGGLRDEDRVCEDVYLRVCLARLRLCSCSNYDMSR